MRAQSLYCTKTKTKRNETRTNIEQEILTGKLKTKETLQ